MRASLIRFASQTVMLASGLVAGAAAIAGAQGVLIAPNAVVIDARTRSSAVTLVNSAMETVEVELGTQFGFPATDSTGAMFLRTFESAPDSMPSAANWVRAFPQKLILAGGERRTVRVLVTPPPALPAGEYWSRLVVTTRTAPHRGHAEGDTSAVQIGLNVEVRSVMPLFYRNGAVSTGVVLATPTVAVGHDSLTLRVGMTRKGNAAFVGTIHASIRDERGSVVARDSLPLGVYYEMTPRIAMKRPAQLAAGKYTVTIDAITARADVSPSLLVSAPATRVTGEFVVSGSSK